MCMLKNQNMFSSTAVTRRASLGIRCCSYRLHAASWSDGIAGHVTSLSDRVRVDEHGNNTIPGAQVRRLAPPAKTQRDERCLVCTMLTLMGCLPAADVWPCEKRLQIVWETCSWLFFDRQNAAMISTPLGKAKNMTPVGHLFFRGGSRCGLISDS